MKVGPLARTRGEQTPLVVAVVLNWNGFRDTVECVESLLRSDIVPAHIVVCDNGSVDGSYQRFQEWATRRAIPYEAFAAADATDAPAPSAQLVFVKNGGNLGYAGGNNVGIRYAIERAGAGFVWVLNNDVVVDSSALDRMLAIAAADHRVAIVGSKILNYNKPETIQVLGGGYIYPVICHDTQLGKDRPNEAIGPAPIEVDHLIGANLLVRSGAVRDVGLIDESYFLYREETDWCIRMRRRGWRLVCCTDATIWHKQSRSIGFKSKLHDYYAVRNMLRLVQKFYPYYLPTAFAYVAARALLPKLARMQFGRAAAVCEALRDFTLGIGGRPDRHTDAAFLSQYGPRVLERRRSDRTSRLRAPRVKPAIEVAEATTV